LKGEDFGVSSVERLAPPNGSKDFFPNFKWSVKSFLSTPPVCFIGGILFTSLWESFDFFARIIYGE
jgi:hypothetical protein